MGFTKLDENIITSTIWAEDSDTVRLWIYLLAAADSEGIVRVTIPALALHNRLGIGRVEEILAKFAAPDPHSRSRIEDGRRLHIENSPEFRIVLVNYEKYRSKDHTHAERQRRYREKLRRVSDGVTLRHTVTNDGGVTQAEAEAEADIKKETEKRRHNTHRRTREVTLVRDNPPTPEEVHALIQEKGYHFTAEEFMGKGEAIGWVSGKGRTPLESWKGWAAQWEGWWKRDHPELQPSRRGPLCVKCLVHPPAGGSQFCSGCLEGILAESRRLGVEVE